MHVLLLQLDGSQPNLALMRIAAHHRRAGDAVTLRKAYKPQDVERRLGDDFGRVYASAIFERTRPVAERLLKARPDAVVGGTGWDYSATLEAHGIDGEATPDYSIYPDYKHSIGFTQRGCRLKCEFCVVPRKEGAVRQAATIHDIWRGGKHPKNILLLDNDFFGQPHWRERIREIREGNFKVCFNQGINARLLPDEGAEAIASVRYMDNEFKRPRIYTAWDSRPDEAVLFRGLSRLVRHGVKPDHIMVYMLIGYWAGETEEDWLYRQSRLREFGCRPYPMPYVRNDLTRGFQRWVVGAFDKPGNANHVPWPEWKAAECEPRNLKHRGRMPLPLFDGLP